MKQLLACLLPLTWLLGGAISGWTEETQPVEMACPNGLTVDAGDWPWWRGPTLDGKAVGPPPPSRWSEKQNVIWRVNVPGLGHASPCIWGDRIFIATAEGKPGESTTRKGITIVHPSGSREVQSLVCYDRATGRQRWRTDVHRGGFGSRHTKNSHATATPVCSEDRVFVTGGDPQTGIHAIRTSPVECEGLVFVPNEAGRMFVFKAGRKLERVAENDLGEGGFASPVIAGGHLYLRTLKRLYCIGD